MSARVVPRLAKATARDLGVPVFRIPPCARCGAFLADRDGNPRWDVTSELRLVCLGGCMARARARKAQRP